MASTESLSTTESRSTESPRRQQLVARTVAVLGLALVGAGVAAVFTTDSDTGAAALLAVGVLLVLLVVFEDRLESLRYGDLELVLRRKADEAVERGDLQAAKVLRDAADTVGERVARAAHSYKSCSSNEPRT